MEAEHLFSAIRAMPLFATATERYLNPDTAKKNGIIKFVFDDCIVVFMHKDGLTMVVASAKGDVIVECICQRLSDYDIDTLVRKIGDSASAAIDKVLFGIGDGVLWPSIERIVPVVLAHFTDKPSDTFNKITTVITAIES